MTAVHLAVTDVVDQVDRAGERAKNEKGRQGATHGGRIEQTLTENQRRKQNQILRPLLRPERDEQTGDSARGD
jgi:hypothetical protein